MDEGIESSKLKAQVVENEEEHPQEKKKITLYTLGEEPYVFEDEEEENFISCRLGEIKENSLFSDKIKILALRNNLIGEIKGLNNLPNL